MDGPFYCLSADDRVPRDAVHVVVGGSIAVVAPYAFDGYRNLERVELREGVELIGTRAFARCPNLTRVDCRASSLRMIGDRVFAGCERLAEVLLCEGLEKIGRGAFHSCDLRRITVPSSVVKIGEDAFGWCHRLSEVNLLEGLRLIGARAFSGFSLRRITIPSSVVEIEEGAFAGCDNLEAATLAGGMVLVARNAFVNCTRLERIAIPSAAIVVEAGEDGNGHAAAVTGGIERNPANESPRLIMASPHLASMRPDQLRNLTDAVDLIADWTHEAGSLDLADGDVSSQIRECFVYRLSVWYRWYKREVATILELALWKIELGQAREVSRSRAVGVGETAGADVPTRDSSRRTCGADPIVGLVLSSLAGSHRRADQAENSGSIQL